MRRPLLLAILFCLAGSPLALAGSATWNAAPVDSNWNNPANWTPQTVPNGPDDVATFGTSNITAVSFHQFKTNTADSYSVALSAIVFSPGASAFSINLFGRSLTISGAGVINNSGTTQKFICDTSTAGFVSFQGTATAGDLVQHITTGDDDTGLGFTFYDDSTAATSTFVLSAGSVTFRDNSTAANSTIIVNGGGVDAYGGGALFFGTSSASHAQIFAHGATLSGGRGAFVFFNGTADQAVITVGGSDVGDPANLSFQDFGTAANATLIAESGQAYGGQISFAFVFSPTGATETITLTGNGILTDLSDDYFEIGSLAGDGLVALGSLEGANLAVGRNNLSTTFSGVDWRTHRRDE